MFENYLKTALRNFWRYYGYSMINLAGLAIGLATCIIILTYISYELSFDKFHTDHEDVYRLAVKGRFAEDFFDVAVSMPALPVALKEKYPEVMAFTRVNDYDANVFFSIGDRKFYGEGLYFVDSTFFEVFTFTMKTGDPSTALNEPYSLVISESVAEKYFGEGNPMGQVIRMNDQVSMKITGVLYDIPENSHMKFTMLGSISTLIREEGRQRYVDNWGSLFLHSYIRLAPGTGEDEFNKTISHAVRDAFGELADQYNIEMIPYLQRVADIHLRSNKMAELEPNSSMSYIYIFSAVAVFILVIACINFMNLSTARATRRSREVGMRKVSGATRQQLIWQFLSESFLYSLTALLLAFGIVEAVMPMFMNMTGLNLEQHFHRPFTVLVALGLSVVVGFLAGAYPALVLSSFQPIRVIKGDLYKGMKQSVFRNLLVVAQFTISISLLISTWLIYKQMQFVQEKNLGYDQENLVVIPLKADRLKEKGESMRQAFAQLPAVKMSAVTTSIPGRSMDGSGYVPEGIDSKSPWIIYTLRGDYNMPEVLGMQLREGRWLSKQFGTDSSAAVINEALVRKLGWDEPVGRKIFRFGDDDGTEGAEPVTYTVVGVVGDYHFKSLHDAIEPGIILLDRGTPDYLVLRLFPGNATQNVESLQKKWEELEQAFPFDYFFMKDEYEDLYRSEQRMAGLFLAFTLLAMMIACLGLFGLALFSISQRTKEIGIRKILGSSVTSLLVKLSKEFSRWVILATVIAWPVAYLLVDNWLESFAYRIQPLDYWWIFLAGGLIALFIALITVLYQAYRAATLDPVQAVKWE
jgi:putative ABC transport system permease protein